MCYFLTFLLLYVWISGSRNLLLLFWGHWFQSLFFCFWVIGSRTLRFYSWASGSIISRCLRFHCWGIGCNIAAVLHLLTKSQLRMDRFRVFIDSSVWNRTCFIVDACSMNFIGNMFFVQTNSPCFVFCCFVVALWLNSKYSIRIKQSKNQLGLNNQRID